MSPLVLLSALWFSMLSIGVTAVELLWHTTFFNRCVDLGLAGCVSILAFFGFFAFTLDNRFSLLLYKWSICANIAALLAIIIIDWTEPFNSDIFSSLNPRIFQLLGQGFHRDGMWALLLLTYRLNIGPETLKRSRQFMGARYLSFLFKKVSDNLLHTAYIVLLSSTIFNNMYL